MAVDPRFANSSGYFKDPVTGEDLSIDTPRVVPCELKDGKFVWPMVAASDGSQLLKIVYKFFTDEEKELYKQYRGRSSSGEPRPKKEKPVKAAELVEQVEIDDSPATVVRFDNESAVSKQAEEALANCDYILATVQVSGLSYALLGKYGSRTTWYIPRACIPDERYKELLR